MTPGFLSRAVAAVVIAAAAMAASCARGPIRTDPMFARIEPGLTRDEVQRLLGPPDETMRFPLSNTVSWDYHYTDTWGYMAVFYVTFDADGRVVSRISRRINDGGDHSSR